MKYHNGRKTKKLRSDAQNRALHKWFNDNAKLMTEQGITTKQIVNVPYEIFVTPEILKSIWKEIQKDEYAKTSTTELNQDEINPLIDIMVKNIGQYTGYQFTPFPSVEEMIHQEQLRELQNEKRTHQKP